jgi:hypothetical protein
MSYTDVFKSGGHPYDVVDRLIDRLERGLQNAASRIFRFVVRHTLDGTLAVQKHTDAEISAETGLAPRTVQKGLNALDKQAADQLGQPLINRQSGKGCHGRRTIAPTVGLAAGREGRPSAPPGPPTEREEDTTIRARSSSSPGKEPEKGPNPADSAVAALIDRAMKLIPEATGGKVIDAVGLYGPDWVSRALDLAEARNKRPGKLPVQSWGFVLGTLKNWHREGGPPPPKAAAPAPAPRPAAPPEQPPRVLTADEVAALIGECRQAGYLGRFARVRLSLALKSGEIPAESRSGIPADLLASPEVLGRGSS